MTRLRRLAPTSLTARLVVTAVLLVATVSLLIAALATVALRAYLLDQLDRDVVSASRRAAGPLGTATAAPSAGPSGPGSGRGEDEAGRRTPPEEDEEDGPGRVNAFGQGPGTLTAYLAADGTTVGSVLTDRGDSTPLSDDALSRLAELDPSARPQEVSLPEAGEFRVVVQDVPDARQVTGLPTSTVDRTLGRLLALEGLLTLAGVAVAGGAAVVLVRRQLRPLRRVAGTARAVATVPLSSGEVGDTARVPPGLTDERTEAGQVGAALNTLLDHVEEALRARHASEQQVRQFVADASHELRTPLATIQGYAELTRTRPDEETATLRQAMSRVEVEAQRMSSLVEDLLLLARLDAGRPLEQSPVDLTRLVLEDSADARLLAPDHRWVLDLSEQPVLVSGDEQRLHQTLVNLLGNARRHTPPGTTVTVSLRPGSDRGAVLTVHDDGPGIPPELTDRAFERFARGDAARTRASGSVGLGLSLVRAIVTAHGGDVSLESRPGSTSFVLRLP